MARKDDDSKPVIIIKRVKKVEGGHHGGAWKVAYADFVTAMMAFFLLLWLLSVTTSEQKASLASYFAPTDPRVSQDTSGAGGVMGGTTISEEGAMTETSSSMGNNSDVSTEDTQIRKADEALDRQDEKSFKDAEDSIKQAIQTNPELKELMQNLLIDMTPEGLRIQIIDQEGKPMFAIGSATPLPQTEKLLTLITGVIKKMPNKISVRGHTDSKKYGGSMATYTNWELSADRANASRRVMIKAELDPSHIENVQGKADREPLLTNDPENARNRRISIILLKQSLVKGMQRAEQKMQGKKPSVPAARPEPKKREEGVIYFP